MSEDKKNDAETLAYNRRLKKAVLDVMFRDVETFYVHCMPDPHLEVGKRGLVDKEGKEGIIFVFGPYSTRHLSWDDLCIYCDMQFGRWEQVAIPYECIARIFDKSGQVIMQWAVLGDVESQSEVRPAVTAEAEVSGLPKPTAARIDAEESSRVIQVDFSKKKPR